MPERPQMSPKIADEEAEMIVQFVVPGLTNLLPAFALNVAHAQQVSILKRDQREFQILRESNRSDNASTCPFLTWVFTQHLQEMPEMCLENSLAS